MRVDIVEMSEGSLGRWSATRKYDLVNAEANLAHHKEAEVFISYHAVQMVQSVCLWKEQEENVVNARLGKPSLLLTAAKHSSEEVAVCFKPEMLLLSRRLKRLQLDTALLKLLCPASRAVCLHTDQDRRRTDNSVLNELKAAIAREDLDEALLLRKQCVSTDLRYGLYAKLLGLCARNKKFKEAEEMFNEHIQLNSRPHPGMFGAMLDACTLAEERLPISPVYAEKAAHVFQRMQTEHGLKPTKYHFHALMDAQGRAGLVDEAFETAEVMQQQGIAASQLTLQHLLKACRVAGKPQRAVNVFHEMRDRKDIEVNTFLYNMLLGACLIDKDRAYHVWTEMARNEVPPDEFTLRLLVRIFSGNANLASEIMQEAIELRSRLLGRGAQEELPAGNEGRQLLAHHGSEAKYGDKPLLLNLHRMSVPAGRIAIHNRLNLLIKLHAEGKLLSHPTSEAAEGGGPGQGQQGQHSASAGTGLGARVLPSARDHGLASVGQRQTDRGPRLLIICGLGKHSGPGCPPAVLRDSALAALEARGIQGSVAPHNPGRVVVEAAEMLRFLEREKDAERSGRLLHFVGLRTVAVGMGICSLTATAWLVPALLAVGS